MPRQETGGAFFLGISFHFHFKTEMEYIMVHGVHIIIAVLK